MRSNPLATTGLMAGLLLTAATCVEVRLVSTGTGGAGGGGGTTTTTTTTTASAGGAGGMGGGGAGGAGGASCGCGQLDVLLAIDNSDSVDVILSDLATLGNSLLPLLPILGEVTCDLHLGVVTAMPQLNNPDAECEVLGALSHANLNDVECFPDVDRNYATSEDYQEKLLCLLQTGSQSSDDERMMDAVIRAATDPDGTLAVPGGCNEGFIRPDAPLIVILITDIDDTESDGAGTPQLWRTQLSLSKGGDIDKLVTVGIIPAPVATCEATEDAPNLHAFLDDFPDNRSARTDICAPAQMDLEGPTRAILDEVCPTPGL